MIGIFISVLWETNQPSAAITCAEPRKINYRINQQYLGHMGALHQWRVGKNRS